jgi:hypothetical protein
MTARKPYKPSTKKDKAEQTRRTKRLNAIKTALPLFVTLALLGVVYYFVLVPVKPENTLRNAIINTLDSEKQKSVRISGSFGSEDSDIEAEYSYQLASDSDSSFNISIGNETEVSSLDMRSVGATRYIRFEGLADLESTMSRVVGLPALSAEKRELLALMDGKWLSYSSSQQNVGSSILPCSDAVPFVPSTDLLKAQLEKNSPYEIVGGPYDTGEGGTSRMFEVGLSDTYIAGEAPDFGISTFIECLDDLRTDDYRLREVNKNDLKTVKYSITIDTLANVVNKVVYKQFGNYFQIQLRDFNKDVSILPPDSSEPFESIAPQLSEQTKLKLLQGQL